MTRGTPNAGRGGSRGGGAGRAAGGSSGRSSAARAAAPGRGSGAPATKRGAVAGRGSGAPATKRGAAPGRGSGAPAAKRGAVAGRGSGAPVAKRGAARRGQAPLSQGAARAVRREQAEADTPLSGAARKAVAGRYERQARASDEGRVRSAKRSSRAAERPSPSGAARRVSDRTLGGEQVEGRQAVRELLLAGRRKVIEIWVATDVDGEHGTIQDIVDLATDQRVPLVEVNRRRLDQAARSEAPQGVLAKAAPLPEVDLDALLRRRPGRPPFLLAIDGVTDPGNLGALMRSAEGAGVTGVLLPRHRSVHVTPTVAKAAAGAVEHLDVAVVPGLPSALAACRERGLWVVGLDDAAERSLFEMGDLGAEGIVMVVGAEGAGLSRLVRERCDLVVSIPMRGRIGSLNVSNAGALALYEVTRTRVKN